MHSTIKFYVFYYVICLFAKYVNSGLLGCLPSNYHTVSTSFGSVVGCVDTLNTQYLDSTGQNVSIYSYKGIRYAESPTGNRRFEKTVPLNYTGQNITINATMCGSPCLQSMPVDVPAVPSEDCLFLNIFTPTTDTSANLSVMFWIHGGADQFGSGCELLYDGSVLASRRIVFVSINYRLGVFGNLFGNSSEAPGNAGFWDQTIALNWTIQYISCFGGNPNDITVFGASGGSWSLSYLIVSPFTQYWFNKAIMQSGSAYIAPICRSPEYNYKLAKAFASNSTIWASRGGACDTTANDTIWINCLKAKSENVLLAASTLSLIFHTPDESFLELTSPFYPMWGDFFSFAPKPVQTAVNNGDFNKDLILLFGHTDMECILYAFAASLLQPDLGGQRYNPLLPYVPILNSTIVYNDIKDNFILNQTIGPIAAKAYTSVFTTDNILNTFISSVLLGLQAASVLLQSIFNLLGIAGVQNRLSGEDPNAIRKAGVQAFSDFALICPTILFGANIAQKSRKIGNVYQYRLTYRYSLSASYNSIWAGAAHGDDLPLMFGMPLNPTLSIAFSADDRNVSRIMVNIWTQFAKNGAPPNVNNQIWPSYSLKSDGSVNATYLELDYDNMGKVYVDRYRGNDGYFTGINVSAVNNCFDFWDAIFKGMF